MEHMRPFLVPPLARVAKAKNLRTVFIIPPGKTPQDSAPFDEILESERWDLSSLRAMVDTIAETNDIVAIVPTDFLSSSDGVTGAHAAALARERGLPCQPEDAIIRCVNKYLTRDALRAAGVPTVDFGLATDESSAVAEATRIGFPIIMKPLTGAASTLIMKCESAAEVANAFRIAMEHLPKASFWRGWKHAYPDKQGKIQFFDPDRCMLVEKYIKGPEASIECVSLAGEVRALVVHDKVRVVESERVVYEDILVTPPVRFSPDEIEKMRDYAVRVMKAVGLDNSFAHIEVRYDEKLGPQLLEINPRVGGAYIADSLRTFCGIDTATALMALALGEFRLPSENHLTQAPHAGFAFMPSGVGTIQRCDGVEEVRELPGMLKVTQNYPVGASINGANEEIFLVTAWMKGESLEHILETYEQANRLLQVQVA